MQNWLLWILAILLFMLPYNRGLFFYKELQIFHVLFACVFLSYWWTDFSAHIKKKKEHRLLLLDIGLILLILGYALSTFFAVNLREALGELFKHINYFLVYFVVSRGLRDTRQTRTLLYALFSSGVVVALLGLGTAFGTFTISGAFEEATGRILSTLQYANTNAIFLTVQMVIGIYLAITTVKPLERVILTGLNGILFLTFLGTQSRGGLLVLGLVVLLVSFGTPSRKLRSVTTVLAMLVGAVAMVGNAFSTTMSGSNWLYVIGTFIIASVIAGALIWVESMSWYQRLESREAVIIPLVALLVIGLGFGTFTIGKDLLPANIVDRIEKIDFEQHSVVERGYFNRDALKAIQDVPVTGAGGGAWKSLYKEYQSYYYISTQVHNHYIQAWLEGGILALLGWVVVWFTIIAYAWHLRPGTKVGSEEGLAAWFVLTAAVALGSHSFIDFNLTFGSLSIILWTLFAILANLFVRTEARKPLLKFSAFKGFSELGWVLSILLVIYSAFSLAMTTAEGDAREAASLLKLNQVPQALSKYEDAMGLNPLEASYKADWAQLAYAIAKQKKDDAGKKEAITAIQRAEELDRGNPKYYMVEARMRLDGTDWQGGVKAMEKTLALAPWDQQYYDFASEVWFKVGLFLRKQGNKDEAENVFAKVVELNEQVTKRVSSLDEEQKRLWVRVPMLTVSEAMKTNASVAKRLL